MEAALSAQDRLGRSVGKHEVGDRSPLLPREPPIRCPTPFGLRSSAVSERWPTVSDAEGTRFTGFQTGAGTSGTQNTATVGLRVRLAQDATPGDQLQ